MKTKSNVGQSLEDIVITTSGSLESLVALAKKNDISITTDIETGTELDRADVVKSNIVNQYVTDKVIPATAIYNYTDATVGGIGYMGIEVNFIIS